MSWGIVFFTNTQNQISQITTKSWIFLILSGLSTGISWICYFHAIKIGKIVNVVAIDKLSIIITVILSFIILKEEISLKVFIGCILIFIGTLFMIK